MGETCYSQPKMTVKVGGKQVLSTDVTDFYWRDYAATISPAVSGQQQVDITFSNDNNSWGECDGNLWIDKVTFTSTTPTAAHGVFEQGTPAGTYSLVDNFASLAGAYPPVQMWYQSWTDPWIANFQARWMDMVDAHGQQAMITWEPFVSGYQPLRAIANGEYDTYIRKFAEDSKAWGRPYYLRFAHEMNGNWYPWSPGVNGNTSADYVAAWRHVHDIFVAEGATNVKWVWSPNEEASCPGCTPIEELYPGDSYVDLTAIDGYNWGTTDASGWRPFTSIFASTYDKITTVVAPSKPILIGETSSVEQGGDKAAWITSSYGTEIPNRFPRLVAVIWFHENEQPDRPQDWRVNSSPAALDAYQQAIANGYYQLRALP